MSVPGCSVCGSAFFCEHIAARLSALEVQFDRAIKFLTEEVKSERLNARWTEGAIESSVANARIELLEKVLAAFQES